MGARVGAVHDGLVGPFEVERLDQRLAHAGILEFFAAQIDEPALRTRGRIVRQRLALDTAVLDGRKIIARCPYPRRELLAIQIVLRRKAFVCDIPVAVEFVTHDVEIICAAADREIGGPPILDPVVLDVPVYFEPSHLVGPGSQGDIERRFLERPGRVISLRENRKTRDIKRHVARALLRECDDQRRVVERFGLHHVAHLLQNQRMALGLQRSQRESGVLRGQS